MAVGLATGNGVSHGIGDACFYRTCRDFTSTYIRSLYQINLLNKLTPLGVTFSCGFHLFLNEVPPYIQVNNNSSLL